MAVVVVWVDVGVLVGGLVGDWVVLGSGKNIQVGN